MNRRRAYDHTHLSDDVIDPGSDAPIGNSILTLGPYTVSFDDPNIGTDIFQVTDLDAGLTILSAWFLPTTEWMHGGSPPTSSFYISVSGLNIASYDHVGTPSPYSEPDASSDPDTASVFKSVVVTQVGAVLEFQAYPDNGSLSQGVADIYLLVV